MIILSFCVFLLMFVLVGVSSVRRSKKNNKDYLLAGQDVQPWLVGLSAVATNNSGYMFIGIIGFYYTTGLAAIWLMVGWIIGDWVASAMIHRKLRETTQTRDINTFGGALATWLGTNYRWVRLAAGVISIVFLGAYAAAQFTAGSKALHVLFGWDYYVGALIGSVMVLLYCFAGGLRASIWTDAAQSIVMILAMAVLLVVAVQTLGGVESAVQRMAAIPDFLDLFPAQESLFGGFLGPLLFVVGWFFAGFGVVGQPHIMVRFMAIEDAAQINRARAYYYTWFTLFYLLATGVGMLSRILLPEAASFDAELALPTIALDLLPAVLVGLVLAGIFAATMSTADSLVLSCSAALTHDIFHDRLRNYWLVKAATVFVTALALTIALIGPDSVFALVLTAWSVLAGAFAPLLCVYIFKQRPTQALALAMILAGVAMVYVWRYSGLNAEVYEAMPAILSGLLVFFVGKYFGLVHKTAVRMPPAGDAIAER